MLFEKNQNKLKEARVGPFIIFYCIKETIYDNLDIPTYVNGKMLNNFSPKRVCQQKNYRLN